MNTEQRQWRWIAEPFAAAEFDDAAEARSIMLGYGYIPLAKNTNAEHWVKNGRRVILWWGGDAAKKTPLIGIGFASFVKIGDAILLILD